MRAISGRDFISTFLHIEKLVSFQTLTNKIDERSALVNLPHSLKKVCLLLLQCICYLYEENKSPSIFHELAKNILIHWEICGSFPYLGIVWVFKFNRFLSKAHGMGIYQFSP